MKVEFNEAGDLVVFAEDNTERVALIWWWDLHNKTKGEGALITVNANAYLEDKEKADQWLI